MGRPRTGFWLVVATLALLAGAKPVLFDTLDPDCFWHLRVAEQLRAEGIGPVVDHLSFASDWRPWSPYSWLAELGMAVVWDAGGYRGAVACQAALQAAIVVLLAMACLAGQQLVRPTAGPFVGQRGEPDQGAVDEPRLPTNSAGNAGGRSAFDEDDDEDEAAGGSARRYQYLPAAVATAAGTFLSLPYLSWRPVTAAFVLLLAAWVLVLRDLAGGRRRVWWVVPITVVLANVHPFVFLVPAAMFALTVGLRLQRRPTVRRYAGLTIATALAAVATPMLPGLVRTAVYYVAADRMVAGPTIAEMQSFARGPAGVVAAVVVAGMAACVGRRWRAVGLGPVLCGVGATVLLLHLGRFAPVFAIAACPLVAATLPRMRDHILGRPVVVFALVAVLVAGVVRVGSSFPSRSMPLAAWLDRYGPTCPGYPCAAAAFVADRVPPTTGRIVNEFSWGGYLAWRLGGRFQVLLDGRTQVYPPALWQATYLGSDSERGRFLAAVRADAAVVPTRHSLFRQTLLSQGWTTAYHDDWAEVLVPPGAAIARVE